MSEFSASMHILHSSEEDVIKLLENNEISGVVVGSSDSSVTLLADHDDFKQIQSLTSCITYEFAEDHGLMMRFTSQGETIGRLFFQWGEDLSFEISSKLETELAKHNLITQDKVFVLKQALMQANENDFDWENTYLMVDNFAQIFNLFAYDDLSYEYFNRHEEIYREQYPDLKVINN